MNRIKVKPAVEGLKVPDENGNFISADGKEVNKTTYISRRIKDGDLVLVEDKKKKPSKGDK